MRGLAEGVAVAAITVMLGWSTPRHDAVGGDNGLIGYDCRIRPRSHGCSHREPS